MDEKIQYDAIYPAQGDWHYNRNRITNWIKRVLWTFPVAVAAIVVYAVFIHPRCSVNALNLPASIQLRLDEQNFGGIEPVHGLCPQVKPLQPTKHLAVLDDVRQQLKDPVYRNKAIELFSKAIRFETVSYDDMKQPDHSLDGPDYWPFTNFTKFLQGAYPGVHTTLKHSVVNKHSVLYTWKGSEPTLKPTLFFAHYDVVPVSSDTLGEWTYPPFKGVHAQDRIWGRGATDMKHSVTAIMGALEILIKHGFRPRRTIMFVLGSDEEIGGLKGAKEVSKEIQRCIGEDSVAVLVDEGGGQFKFKGQEFVTPGVAEKGYLDVQIDIRVGGGHSSSPDEHTGIGIAADFITGVENHPYDTYLSSGHPLLSFMGCAAEWAPKFPPELRPIVKKRLTDPTAQPPPDQDYLARNVSKMGGPPNRQNTIHWIMTTTQAFTIIEGGFKINALPDLVRISMNHRIHIEESVDFVKAKLKRHGKMVAEKFNLTLYDFGETNNDKSFKPPSSVERSINLIGLTSLDVAPKTPTNLTIGRYPTPYAITAGTILEVMGSDKVVSPLMVSGNTDSRHFWNLTKNIIRFSAGAGPSDSKWIHTVDESMSVDGHFKGLEWYSVFIMNMDQAELANDHLEKKMTC